MSERLDDLARQMARGASRRRLLGLFGGVIAGGALATFAQREPARAGLFPCAGLEDGQRCAECCRDFREENNLPGRFMGNCMRACLGNQ